MRSAIDVPFLHQFFFHHFVSKKNFEKIEKQKSWCKKPKSKLDPYDPHTVQNIPYIPCIAVWNLGFWKCKFYIQNFEMSTKMKPVTSTV